MIGFYNYSVILTYIGLGTAVYGMTATFEGHSRRAILCLIICGICDMFDGKIARAMKRTKDAEKFGIQIDSLCDLVCFGVFPAIIAYTLGMNGIIGKIVMILYILGAVIRLGFFNVMEEKRQDETTEVRKYYQGLPVTSVALLLPISYIFQQYLGKDFIMFLTTVMAIISFLFVVDIKVKKPDTKTMPILAIIAIVTLAKIFKLF